MSPKKENKAPTPSESTKIFEKRITGSTYLSPYPTKYSMSSKDWSEMSKRVDSLMSGEHDEKTSINF